jgi:transposase
MTPAAAAAEQPPLTADTLPDDPGMLKSIVLELLLSLQHRDRDCQALRHQLDGLLRRLYGPRSERFDPKQLLLFVQQQLSQDTDQMPPAEPAEPAASKRKCRPHGRRRLPDNLRRETRHHELTAAERLCSRCGRLREEIAVDRSEQLEYHPASLFVVEHVIHKYACPCCARRAVTVPCSDTSVTGEQEAPASGQESTPFERPGETVPTEAAVAAEREESGHDGQASDQQCTPASPSAEQAYQVVIAAAKPPMPIAKGLPGPGLLAHLIVSKYVDHLPLHRLERIYERQGVFLPRSTLCDWLMASGQLLLPLYEVLVRLMLQSRALHTDDTPLKMQDPKTHVLSTARMWAYLGDDAHPYNVFDFTLTRKRDGPQRFLAGYQGYLHADAFSGYDGLYLPDPLTNTARVVEVACNAHARRKFYEARSSDQLRSHLALAYYGQLYELERPARDFSESQRLQMRQDLALVILEKFRAWIDKTYPEVLPKSPMGEALGYVRNNWTALVRYTEAGFLDIDNNVAEREMKRIAIGRKNWLFVGSPQGGQTAAVLMTFTSTCNRLGIEPWAYLHDVLERLPMPPGGALGRPGAGPLAGSPAGQAGDSAHSNTGIDSSLRRVEALAINMRPYRDDRRTRGCRL